MKLSINSSMFIIMPIIGILFSVVYFYFMMPLFGNDLVLCIILGAVFGLVNYFTVIGLFKKYDILKHSNSILKSDLRFDKLTGVFNRRAFDYDLEKLQKEISYTMVFIDIDNFKMFNDQYGHKVGDDVLIKAVKSIQLNLRNSDNIYRYGGEEFVVVLKNCDKHNALDISEKIRKGVESIDNHLYDPISVSLGVSSYPEDGINAAVISENCDKALLRAKRLGKNRIELHKKTAE